MGPNSQSKNPDLAGVLDRGTLVVIMQIVSLVSEGRKWSSQETNIVMECYLLSEPKVRGYRKHMLSLQLNKGMFWVSEQRLVDQANTIRSNSWMTELEIEELKRKVTRKEVLMI